MRTSTPDLSVVVPCFNEAANVVAIAHRIGQAADRAQVSTEIVFVDDGSTDRTWDVLDELAQQQSGVVALQHPVNRGMARAWQFGVEAASGRYVALIDADLQNPPEEIFTLYRKLLASREDIAQGVRSSIDRLRDSRYALSRTLNLLLNVGFGMRSKDNKSGFILAPKPVLLHVLESAPKYKHFQTFVGPAANANGYSILEVETLFQDRNAGVSFLAGQAGRVSIEVLREFPRALIDFRRRDPAHAVPGRQAHRVDPHDSAVSHRARRKALPYRGWRRLWLEAYFATMPLHKWLIRRRARSMYIDLCASQWWGPDELRELQDAKLSRLIQHVYSHVPYYRDRMDATGIRPSDIQTTSDLSLMPLLGKSDVRENLYFELFADNHRKSEMHRVATSGSTGEPFVTYADRYQLEMRFATTLRALEWTGWRVGDRQARLWHQTLGMTRSQVLRERVDALFMRRKFIPAFELSEERLERVVRELADFRPVLLDGYAESLNFLASYLTKRGNPGLSPKGVMSSAQVLPDQTRTAIEATLGTRVFDKYGSREFSGIAYECGHGSVHHVMDESYVVEILVEGRPAHPGEVGEVVVTDLNNFSVPLIRYRVGDLATEVDDSKPCPCGRGLSRIGAIQGRSQALVHCANGTWLPGTFFAHFFKDYEYLVRHFQIEQSTHGEFLIRVVAGPQYSEHGFARLVDNLREYTGVDTKISCELVDEIPLLRTGKRTPVISSLTVEFQDMSVSSGRGVEAAPE
jgi:phenylacetate-CoA ligase